ARRPEVRAAGRARSMAREGSDRPPRSAARGAWRRRRRAARGGPRRGFGGARRRRGRRAGRTRAGSAGGPHPGLRRRGARRRPSMDPGRRARLRGADPQPPGSDDVSEPRETTYLEAIRQALAEEMRRDERVFVLGEDVGVYGGAFKITE